MASLPVHGRDGSVESSSEAKAKSLIFITLCMGKLQDGPAYL